MLFFLSLALLSATKTTIAQTAPSISGNCNNTISQNTNAEISIVCNDPVAAKAIEKISQQLDAINLSKSDKLILITKKLEDLEALVKKKNLSPQADKYNLAIEAYSNNDTERYERLLNELEKRISRTVRIIPIATALGMSDTATADLSVTPPELRDKLHCQWSIAPKGFVNVKDNQCQAIITIPELPSKKMRANHTPTTFTLKVAARYPDGKTTHAEMPVVLATHLLIEAKPSDWAITEDKPVTVSMVYQKSQKPISDQYECEWDTAAFPVSFESQSANNCKGIIRHKPLITLPQGAAGQSLAIMRRLNKNRSNIYVNAKVFYKNQQWGITNLQLRNKAQNDIVIDTNIKAKKTCKQDWGACRGYENLVGLWRANRSATMFFVNPANNNKILANFINPTEQCKSALELKLVNELSSTSEFYFKPIAKQSNCKNLESIKLIPLKSTTHLTVTKHNGKSYTLGMNKKVF